MYVTNNNITTGLEDMMMMMMMMMMIGCFLSLSTLLSHTEIMEG